MTKKVSYYPEFKWRPFWIGLLVSIMGFTSWYFLGFVIPSVFLLWIGGSIFAFEVTMLFFEFIDEYL